MKRVKIMLSAIMVLAIVAGALAFKAKSVKYCLYTTTTLNGAPETTCPSVTYTFVRTIETPVTSIYATTKPLNLQNTCDPVADCEIAVFTTVEQ